MLPGHLLSAAAATALTPFQANGMPLLLHEKPQGSPGHHLPCPFGGVSLLGHGEGQRPGLLELSSGPLLCHATSEVDALPPAFDAYCPVLQVFPLTLSVSTRRYPVPDAHGVARCRMFICMVSLHFLSAQLSTCLMLLSTLHTLLSSGPGS